MKHVQRRQRETSVPVIQKSWQSKRQQQNANHITARPWRGQPKHVSLAALLYMSLGIFENVRAL